MYKKALSLFFAFSLFTCTQLIQSMESPSSSDDECVSFASSKKEKNRGQEEVVGVVLALQKKLAGVGEMVFEDGSKLEKFPGLPADVLVLIAGELAKSGGYTGEQRAGIIFSLVGAKEFKNRKEVLIHCLYQVEEPKDILDAVCLKPLEIALNKGYLQEIIDLNAREVAAAISCLLDGGADPDIKNSNGETALMAACRGGDKLLELVKWLADKGVDPKAQLTGYYAGKTSLMYACEKGDEGLELVKWLADKGVNPKAQDKNGKTSLMYACEKGNEGLELVKWLVDKGVDPKAQATGIMDGGKTALMYACEKGNEGLELVKWLADKGVDPKAQDKKGRTALSVAYKKYAEKLIAFLERS